MKKTLTLLAAAAAGAVLLAPVAHADTEGADDPSTTQEVCGAFNLGMSPDQIIAGLQRNDGRFNYWRAQRDTMWPIIEGECG